MEFLDPEQKRQKTQKLFTIYFLSAFTIAIFTFIFIMIAQGYQIRNKEGVVRNGLIFVESKPVSGLITLNGENRGRTPARILMNEGEYKIQIQSDGYRIWSNSFSLIGGSVRYFTYPKLIPINIESTVLSEQSLTPAWMSQSPDRHWILTKNGNNDNVFFLYDTTKPNAEPLNLTLPANILIGSNNFGNFMVEQWSDDNRHILVRQTLDNGLLNFIVIDREKPLESFSVSNNLQLSQQQLVSLRDDKWDRYYILNNETGQLLFQSKDSDSSQIVAENVLSFSSYSDNVIVYCTDKDAPENLTRVIVQDSGNQFNLQPIARDTRKQCNLGVTKYKDNFYFYISSNSSSKVEIYQNPVNLIGVNQARTINPSYVLTIDSPTYQSNSFSGRFINVQSGNRFVTFDTELKKQYPYELPLNIPLDQRARWVDNFRLSLVVDQKVRIYDFDGTNLQILTESLANPNFYPAFDKESENILTFITDLESSGSVLSSGSLVVR